MTVTVLTPEGDEVSRVHSTHPEVYAVGGRKRLDPSQTSPIWRDLVVRDQQAFIPGDPRATFLQFALQHPKETVFRANHAGVTHE